MSRSRCADATISVLPTGLLGGKIFAGSCSVGDRDGDLRSGMSLCHPPECPGVSSAYLPSVSRLLLKSWCNCARAGCFPIAPGVGDNLYCGDAARLAATVSNLLVLCGRAYGGTVLAPETQPFMALCSVRRRPYLGDSHGQCARGGAQSSIFR